MEKYLPFGASISCSHYQHFSNALKHILEYKLGWRKDQAITNYLDDFLFLALLEMFCNEMICRFLELCQQLNLPVALEKTEWGNTVVVFLGILMDGQHHILSIPIAKQVKALTHF